MLQMLFLNIFFFFWTHFSIKVENERWSSEGSLFLKPYLLSSFLNLLAFAIVTPGD